MVLILRASLKTVGDRPPDLLETPNFLLSCSAEAKQKRPKALHPHLSVGRSKLRKFLKPSPPGVS
jgi:hypothetical protein